MSSSIRKLATASRAAAPYHLLLGASALVLGAAPAFGQAAASDDAGNEILVTGSALQNQAEIESRRVATGILDSLSRDEIGAMPEFWFS